MGGPVTESTHQEIHQIPAGQWILLGSDSACQILVRRPGFPAHAASLQWDEERERLTVVKHGRRTQLTDVNGAHDSIRVSEFEWFEIDKVRFTVQKDGFIQVSLAPVPFRIPRPRLKRPERADSSLTLRPGEFLTLGSAESCDLVVTTPGLPSRAATLRWNAQAESLTIIRHKGADRGVFLSNGAGVHDSVELSPGEWFEIAGTRFSWFGFEFLEASPCDIPSTDPKRPDRLHALTVNNLILPIGHKSRPQKRLELTFSVPMNSVVALCGPSGTGKTTLLRALISAGTRTRGNPTMLLGEEPLHTRGRKRQHVAALVPQETVLAPDVSLGRMLSDAYWLKRTPGGSHEIHETMKKALNNTGLIDVFMKRHNDYMSSFSGGQLKRISLAMELMSIPTILLLDEPNSGLDPASDRALMRSLELVASESSTKIVIMVTHTLVHLPDDAYVILLGIRNQFLSEVAYEGRKADMYLACNAAPGDDAQLMENLENGRW